MARILSLFLPLASFLAVPMNLTAAQLTSFLQAGQAKIGTEVSSEIEKKKAVSKTFRLRGKSTAWRGALWGGLAL